MFFNPKYYDEELDREVGLGWLPPYPDIRDYTSISPKIDEIVKNLKGFDNESSYRKRPIVDLAEYFPSVKNQGNLGSCTANAASGLIEYYQNMAFGDYEPPSRLFIYKTTRNLLHLKGDTGAYLRTTMASLVYFGAPPESYFKYFISEFDKEPSAFIYNLADNYETLKYFCHDPCTKNISTIDVLNSIKRYLRAGIPSIFGFYIFDSINKGRPARLHSREVGLIPFPASTDKCLGGHAVVAIGYDDNKTIARFKKSKDGITTGAFKILNSWGKDWGKNGYGWIPYEFVLKKYALDFWSILRAEWVDTDQFKL